LPDEARLALAFAIALLVTLLATPVAILVARRTDFHDVPGGYKAHGRATPYLGGTAVLVGVLAAAIPLGDALGRFGMVTLGAVVLWIVGTIDDRISLGAGFRVLVELALGAALWATDDGWALGAGGAVDLLATCAWVVIVVSTFAVMDNIDGAAGTVAGVTAAGIAGLALVEHDAMAAVLPLALTGACAGFLRYNLARPARIFLGDGGSLPLGFLLAATAMNGPLADADWPALLAAVVLIGLPMLDATLVLISRRRRGVSPLTGGRDHLTHRLLTRLHSARAVAVALALAQAALSALAIYVTEQGTTPIVATAASFAVVVLFAVTVLETPRWAPPPPPSPQS
jgi:UDP-GlcNAc:undecaprenyl-phosphate/decaprenyl-phosphate GlcNAc-1-phosphate transferase